MELIDVSGADNRKLALYLAVQHCQGNANPNVVERRMMTMTNWKVWLACLGLALGLVFAAIGEAQAGANRNTTPNCASVAEFRVVDTGDSRRLVRRIFDVPGLDVGAEGGADVRIYKACPGARVDTFGVVYRKQGTKVWHLTDKFRG